MKETKGAWYPPVKPFTSHMEEAQKSLDEKDRQEQAGRTRQVDKSELLQKRMEFDLGVRRDG